MGDPDLAQVVQICAHPDGGLFERIQAKVSGDGERVGSDALAMPVGVAIGGFDRLSPVAHYVEVAALQLCDPARNVHQIDARVQPAEKPMRAVEQPQRFLVPAHSLV